MAAFFQRVNSLAPERMRTAHPEVKRFIKFMIVGGFGAVLDVTVLTILVFVFHVPDYVANIISVTCAIISNFTWNTLWTFPETRHQKNLAKYFVQFAIVNIVGLGINEIVFILCDHYLFEPFMGQLGIYPSKIIAIGVVLFWNFGINRIWTYRDIKFGETPLPLDEEPIAPL